MADRYLLESGAPDGYLLEDGSGVLLLETPPGSSPLMALFAGALAAVQAGVAIAACAPPEFNTRTDHALTYRPFANGAIYGMSATVLPAQQVHIAAEPERQPDRSQALHAFRGQQVSAAPTYQPLALYTVTYRQDSVEVEIRRADHNQLHRHRQAFQTVGQPWAMWPKPQRVDAPAEWTQPEVDYGLMFGRVAPAVAASPGQTYTLWQPSLRLLDPEWTPRLRDYWAELAPFRLLPTYGMSVVQLPATPVLVESQDVRQPDTKAHQLFFGRTAGTPPPAATYQPLLIQHQPAKPPIEFTEPWQWRVTDHGNVFRLFSVSFFVSSAVWVEQPHIEPEEYTVRVDHSALLTTFRRPVAVTQPPQPWFLYYKAQQATVEPESYTVNPVSHSILYGRPSIVAPQPWNAYRWQIPTPDTLEFFWYEKPVDHWAKLLPFLITPTFPVVTEPSAFIPPFRRRRR